MWKKTLMALAAVVAITGFTTVIDAGPAEAQHMRRPPPPVARMHRPPTRPIGPMVGRHHRPMPGPHRMYRRDRWYGPGLIIAPGVYGAYEECRIVRKRVRVLTDEGWRYRWRRVRYCD
mgnify:CR=1 FL=1